MTNKTDLTNPFLPDVHLTEFLKSHKFTLSAEVIPPRNGAAVGDIFQQISQLVTAGTQFLSVTKGAGGSLRGGSLPIAQMIKERFQIPCVAHFTCRDLAPEEVENQIMDHHYFGVRNILALRGDPPTDQPDWQPRPNSHLYAHQLLKQIVQLNSGQYLERPGFKAPTREPTSFCLGAAAYPDATTEEDRLQFFLQKLQSGAQYGITQMLFDPKSYAKFLEDLAKNGCQIPILPGTRILKSKQQAQRMSKRFDIPLPKELLNALPESDDPKHFDQAIDVFLGLAERLKSYGAPGIHLFVLSDTELATRTLLRIRTIGTLSEF